MKMLLLFIALMGVPQTPAASPDPFRPLDGQIVRETRHFRIFVENGYVPVDLDWFQAQIETVYADVAARMKIQADRRFDFSFRPPDTRPCPVRGIAVTGKDAQPARATIFITDQTSREQILGITAHEVAHLFHFGAFGAGQPNLSLSEGLATWAAGKYWEAWHKESPTQFVRSTRKDGRYVPPADLFRDEVWANSTATGAECVAQRDLRYTSVAAFLDFLIANYGLEKLKELLGPPQLPVRGGNVPVLPRSAPFTFSAPFPLSPPTAVIEDKSKPPLPPPRLDFTGVYGQTLDELEGAWLEQLSKGFDKL